MLPTFSSVSAAVASILAGSGWLALFILTIVVTPAVWSRKAHRRAAALRVLRVLLRRNNGHD